MLQASKMLSTELIYPKLYEKPSGELFSVGTLDIFWAYQLGSHRRKDRTEVGMCCSIFSVEVLCLPSFIATRFGQPCCYLAEMIYCTVHVTRIESLLPNVVIVWACWAQRSLRQTAFSQGFIPGFSAVDVAE